MKNPSKNVANCKRIWQSNLPSIYQQQYDPHINVISFYTFYFTNSTVSLHSCNGPDPAKNAIKC